VPIEVVAQKNIQEVLIAQNISKVHQQLGFELEGEEFEEVITSMLQNEEKIRINI